MIKNKIGKLLEFKKISDDRGSLTSLEEAKEIPFTTRRVYYLYNIVDGASRGHHAHKELEQVMIALHGSCEVVLDDGKNKETYILNEPNVGLYIKPGLWREMYKFSKDAVLVVLASDIYNEDDYIRRYDDFIEYSKGLHD